MDDRTGSAARLRALCAVFALFAAPGCLSVRMGDANPTARMDGLVNGYVSLNGLRPYDGSILALDVLSSRGRKGELVSVDVWPFGGFGIGLVGARVRVLPLEVGLGALFYHPQPPPPADKGKKARPQKSDPDSGKGGP